MDCPQNYTRAALRFAITHNRKRSKLSKVLVKENETTAESRRRQSVFPFSMGKWDLDALEMGSGVKFALGAVVVQKEIARSGPF